MSEMEQNNQLGELMTLRETQRKTLAHLRLKGDKIAAAYAAFGFNRGRWRADLGSVFLLHPNAGERDLPDYLLSKDDLAA